MRVLLCAIALALCMPSPAPAHEGHADPSAQRQSTVTRKRQEKCVWMAKYMTESASGRRQPTKIGRPGRLRRIIFPTTAQFG